MLTYLTLTNFRNYTQASVDLEPTPVVITGKNGAGKTNILEAISFFSPGRGLRSIRIDEADRSGSSPNDGWSVMAKMTDLQNRTTHFGTGRDPKHSQNRRLLKIDGEFIRSHTRLLDTISVIWLTPLMDGIFIGPSLERRRFLDRLVFHIDAEHATRVLSYEKALRERFKLIKTSGDTVWISLLESKMAELSIAISYARAEAIALITQAMEQMKTPFPAPLLSVEGNVETLLENYSVLQAEEILKEKFYESRRRDLLSNKTTIGAHKSDLKAMYIEKNMPASRCSTGEQKALLLSIVLAEAYAKSLWKHQPPILLLDEVIAHLDEERRACLFDLIHELKIQAWMTGTDTESFEPFLQNAQLLRVKENSISHQLDIERVF